MIQYRSVMISSVSLSFSTLQSDQVLHWLSPNKSSLSTFFVIVWDQKHFKTKLKSASYLFITLRRFMCMSLVSFVIINTSEFLFWNDIHCLMSLYDMMCCVYLYCYIMLSYVVSCYFMLFGVIIWYFVLLYIMLFHYTLFILFFNMLL